MPSGERPVPPRRHAEPDLTDDAPTEVHARVPAPAEPAGSPVEDPPPAAGSRNGSSPGAPPDDPLSGRTADVPGRHRRRAGQSPNSRPAAEYRAQVENGARKARTGRRRRPSFWKELPLLIVVALLLTFLIQNFLAKVYVIPSGSMEQTLRGCTGCTNDRVLVDKVVFRFSDPQPGDVVVFRGPDSWSSEIDIEPPSSALAQVLQQFGSLIGLAPPDEKDFVKRVIAVGGQTVQCCDGADRVLVNGEPLDEPYIYYLPEGERRQEAFGPVTIPDGQLWMMGDSRRNSADSRVPGHGPVPVANVIGKARLIVLPLPRFGWIESVDPRPSAVAMPGIDPGAPLGLGLVGAVPLVLWRRRIVRRHDELDAFLPGRR